MSVKIDLKIICMIALFYITNQLNIYIIMLIFAIIHEVGHLIVGMILGMKVKKIEIIPLGANIQFKLNIDDYNEKILKGNVLVLKKIFVALGGPLTNVFVIILSSIFMDTTSVIQNSIIYANLLLLIFNLIPIYPLDGSRIIKGILHLKYGKQKADQILNILSWIMIILITIYFMLVFFVYYNVSYILIIIFLWFVHIIENKKYMKKNKMYKLMHKMLEK